MNCDVVEDHPMRGSFMVPTDIGPAYTVHNDHGHSVEVVVPRVKDVS